MSITEKQIESDILKWLNMQSECLAFKVNTVGIYDTKKKIFRKNKNPYVIKGTSDIIGLWKGIFFALEVKTKKGKLTEDQRNFLLKVIDREGFGAKVCSLEEAITFFRNLRLAASLPFPDGIRAQLYQTLACLHPPLTLAKKTHRSRIPVTGQSFSKALKVDS